MTSDWEEWKQWVEDDDLYYIADSDIFWLAKTNTSMRDSAYFKQHMITKTGDKQAFFMLLDSFDRLKTSFVCTFGDYDSRKYLNLMTRDTWALPIEGEPHVMFDLLMENLTDGREAVRDHIEQCILWKYTHPEDVTIPALCFYGDEGTGKDTFVTVLETLFEERQVGRTNCDTIFGQFNGILSGKTVMMINESASKKADAEKTKQLVGNLRIQINQKYLNTYMIDNTAWWIFASNDPTGPVKVSGNGDRRFSIIKTTGAIKDKLDDLYDFWVDNYSVFRDKQEVGRWLNSLIMKHGNTLNSCPRALHGEDYNDMLEAQLSFEHMIIEIFNDIGSNGIITNQELYDEYKRRHEDDNPGSKPYAKHYLHARVGAMLNKWLPKWEKAWLRNGSLRAKGYRLK